MNKKLIALAVVGVIVGYGTAANAVEVSGFANIKHYIANDSAIKYKGTASEYNSKEGKFAADAEIDVVSTVGSVTARVDVDLRLNGTGGASAGGALDTDGDGTLTPAEIAAASDTDTDTNGASIEQAMFAWDLDAVTLIGGVFNNPIGYEAEDVTDMIFNYHGAVYTALDSQTKLDGDNVAGVAVAGAVGPVTLTGAFLNDLGQVSEENTFALIANYSPIAGLDLELGLATQVGNAAVGDNTIGALNTSVGDVTNFNVVYTGVENLTLGLDYLAGDVVLDSAYDLWAGYYVGSGFSVNARFSDIDLNNADVTTLVNNVATIATDLKAVGLPVGDSETTTINLTYKIAKNLKAALEVSTSDVTLLSNPSTSNDLTTLKLLATF